MTHEQMSELNQDALKTAAEVLAKTDNLVYAIEAYLAALPKQEPSGAEKVIEAARCIRHWHDTENGGMVVSGSHVRLLWEALREYDAQPLPDPPKGDEG